MTNRIFNHINFQSRTNHQRLYGFFNHLVREFWKYPQAYRKLRQIKSANNNSGRTPTASYPYIFAFFPLSLPSFFFFINYLLFICSFPFLHSFASPFSLSLSLITFILFTIPYHLFFLIAPHPTPPHPQSTPAPHLPPPSPVHTPT